MVMVRTERPRQRSWGDELRESGQNLIFRAARFLP
jgi:hypothetical protein